jgi:hypothetical protein
MRPFRPSRPPGGRTAAAACAWVTPREDLLDGHAGGNAHEADLGVAQITQDLVDVIGVDRRAGATSATIVTASRCGK